MSKKQTRRTVSMNAEVHRRLHEAAAAVGMTAAHYLEDCLRKRLELPETRHYYPNGRIRMRDVGGGS